MNSAFCVYLLSSVDSSNLYVVHFARLTEIVIIKLVVVNKIAAFVRLLESYVKSTFCV